jgi:intein/homing endonuclease
VIGLDRGAGDRPLVRVRTESGRSLVVAEGHALATIGPDGELGPVAPGDVHVGRTRLPVVGPTLDTGPRLPLDRDRGRLAGLYVSEGHCPPAQPGLVNISVQDDGRAGQVKDLLARLGQRGYRNGGAVLFTGHATCGWLLGHFGHLSHAKAVPGHVLGFGRDFLEGLTEGYMGGDGCLWTDGNGAIQVTAVSTSRGIRDGMVDVLAALGVFATLFDAPRSHIKGEWRDGFGYRVISRDLASLTRWFFYDDREAKLRELAREVYRASTFEHVPVLREGRKALYAAFPGPVLPYIYKTANMGAVAKHRLLACTGPYGAWARSGVLWDRVVAVDPAPPGEALFDLAVDGPGLFAAGHGLLLHGGGRGRGMA